LLWTLSALVVLTLVYFGKGMVRKQTNHMAMAIVTSLTLAGVLPKLHPSAGWLVSARPSWPVRPLPYCCFSASVWISLLYRKCCVDCKPRAAEISAAGIPAVPGSCRVPADCNAWPAFGLIRNNGEHPVVRQRTTPDDSVFIGLPGTQDFVNDVLLYFAMDRKSPRSGTL